MIHRLLEYRRLPWVLAALAVLLCSRSLWLGPYADDHFHRAALTGKAAFLDLDRPAWDLFGFLRGDGEANRRHLERGSLPWWSHPELRLNFFRPLSGLSHWLDYRLWPDRWDLMHAHSLLWLAAVVAAAAFFYRRMLAVPAAGLAALLFSLDEAHAVPAMWLANRNALVSVFFGILTLLAHDRWRREGWKAGAFLSAGLFGLALLGSESAVAVGGYLLAYALFLDRHPARERALSLLPCALTGLVWLAAYKAAGYGVSGSGLYIDPLADPVHFAWAAADRAPKLLFGQFALFSDLFLLLPRESARALWMAALLLLLGFGLLLLPLLRERASARFLAAGVLLSALPACAMLASDRLLFFVGLGGMGVVAQLLEDVSRKLPRLYWRTAWRKPARAAAALLVLIHLLLAPLLLTAMADPLRNLAGIVDRAAASFPSGPQAGGRRVWIVSTPSAFLNLYAPLIRSLAGDPVPSSSLVLGSGNGQIELHRSDDRTLLVEPAGGYLAPQGSAVRGFSFLNLYPVMDHLFRGPSPFRPGQEIDLGEVEIGILEVTATGRPLRVAFRFARPLEDPSYQWLHWEGGRYAPFDLMPAGSSVRLQALSAPKIRGPAIRAGR